MERRFHELEGIIAKAKQQAVQQDEEVTSASSPCRAVLLRDFCRTPVDLSVMSLKVNEGDSDDTDLQIFCVSCSHPVNPKVALRHMERCYAKVK